MTTTSKNTYTVTELTLSQKENIIENLIHDLKSSIFSQINGLNLIMRDKNCTYNKMQLDILGNLMTSNIYMRDTISNVLSNFKMDNKGLNIEKSNCSIKETLDFVIRSIGYMFEEKSQKLDVQYRCCNLRANYDDIEMRRVFVNLLSNASKYSKAQSIIKVEIIKEDGFLVCKVINEGKIEDKNIEDIFDMYLTQSKKFQIRGSGLGLYISKKIVEAHGGTIKAQNTKNNEVEFSVKIPC